MEEVDTIILHTLKQLECDIPEEVTGLREFTVEMVIRSAAKCLNAIDVQCSIPLTVSPSMSKRFQLGTSLATACKELGYKGEIGYETFLYANEHDLRKVLMFLIEKIPKDASEVVDEPFNMTTLLKNQIASELKWHLGVPWTPAYCRRKNVVNSQHYFLQGCKSFARLNTCCPLPQSQENIGSFDKMAYVTSHCKDVMCTYASLAEENTRLLEQNNDWKLEWNSQGMASRLSQQSYMRQKVENLMSKVCQVISTDRVRNSHPVSRKSEGFQDFFGSSHTKSSKSKGSRFTHAEKLQFTEEKDNTLATINSSTSNVATKDTEEDVKARQEQELHELQEQISTITADAQIALQQTKDVQAQIEQIHEQSASVQTDNTRQESEYKVKKKTTQFLTDVDTNISRLEELLEKGADRLVQLNEQWNKHRVPLLEKYQGLKEDRKEKESLIETKIKQVQIVQEKMRSCTDDMRTKDDLLKQLVVELEKMDKNVNRSSYTDRIIEIVNNIKKQKEQIAIVLRDTRSLQKDINFLNGKLDRTFTVTDEMVFQKARKEVFSKKAYQLLASLHQSFGSLIETVEETGSVVRATRDLEELIDKCEKNQFDKNLQQITGDLKQVKKENVELLAKFKKASQ